MTIKIIPVKNKSPKMSSLCLASYSGKNMSKFSFVETENFLAIRVNRYRPRNTSRPRHSVLTAPTASQEAREV
jgi:hypothetical protein